MKKLVYAYLRTSNKNTKLALDGDSRDRQLKAIRRFAKSKGWRIKEAFYDCSVSGDNGSDLSEREEFSRMMLLMKSNGVKSFIVSDATRFSRSILTAEIIKQDCRENGIAAYDASTGNDLCVEQNKNPEVDLINSLLSCIAAYDKIKTTNRLQSGRQRKARLGGRIGGNYGYGKTEEESTMVAKAKSLRKAGMSFQKIANTLNDEGYKTRKGTALSYQQIQRIWKRPTSRGASSQLR
jgi:DNA invertase Pin-like site-specific DNA recombinase